MKQPLSKNPGKAKLAKPKKLKQKKPNFLQKNLGVFCLAFIIVVLAIDTFTTDDEFGTAGMLRVQHRLDPREAAAVTVTSCGRPVTEDMAIYVKGPEDIKFVLFWSIGLAGVRHVIQHLLFKPLARLLGQRSKMKVHKFMENGWQAIYYATAWGVGFNIIWGTEWWFGNAVGLGGPEDWQRKLFIGYPYQHHTFQLKTYYLLQASFWVSQIFVTVVEVWRADFGMMMTHHFFTTFMVVTSYYLNHIRAGTAILVEQDLADIFLPIAKMFKYLKMEDIGTVFFVIFAIAWYPTRHYLYCFVWYGIYKYQDEYMTEAKWSHEEGYYNYTEPITMGMTYTVILGLFQCLLLRWGILDLGRAIYKTIANKENVEDHRSDESDSEDEKTD